MSVVPDVQRARRQLRCLDAGYAGAEDKVQVWNGIQAKLRELQMLHQLLPAALREKSWLLGIERYDQWTTGKADGEAALQAR
ncbi:MAG TPA: hypothetical protein VKZ50_17145 [bacterium]|nr:hypothetical protein [bacterium]